MVQAPGRSAPTRSAGTWARRGRRGPPARSPASSMVQASGRLAAIRSAGMLVMRLPKASQNMTSPTNPCPSRRGSAGGQGGGDPGGGHVGDEVAEGVAEDDLADEPVLVRAGLDRRQGDDPVPR